MKWNIKIQEIYKGVVRASCPAFPGCVVYGATHAEAWREIEKAVKGYIASMNGVGHQDTVDILSLGEH